MKIIEQKLNFISKKFHRLKKFRKLGTFSSCSIACFIVSIPLSKNFLEEDDIWIREFVLKFIAHFRTFQTCFSACIVARSVQGIWGFSSKIVAMSRNNVNTPEMFLISLLCVWPWGTKNLRNLYQRFGCCIFMCKFCFF